MNIAFVGCGYVADLYIQTLKFHPNLKVVGVYDRDAERTRHFADHHGLRAYEAALAEASTTAEAEAIAEDWSRRLKQWGLTRDGRRKLADRLIEIKQAGGA